MDGNVVKTSFRLQIEAFNGIAGSTNGNGQKNLQVMDAFVTAKISKAFQVRVGQYYLPLGYENYDLSPFNIGNCRLLKHLLSHGLPQCYRL